MRHLTDTQKIILRAADQHERGLVQFGAGDRRGARVVGYAEIGGHPIIVAYSNPEYFLKSRGLIEPYGNGSHVFQITDRGREAIRKRWRNQRSSNV